MMKKLKTGLKQVIQLGQTFAKEFALVFRFAPAHAAILTLTQVFIGVIPAAIVFLTALVIDEITKAIAAGTGWSSALSFPVGMILVALLIQRVVFLVQDYVSNYLRGYLQLAVNDRIHRNLLRLDLPTLERPDVQTLIAFLKEQVWRPSQMVHTTFQMSGNIVASLSFITITLTFSPLITLLFLLAVIPGLLLSTRTIYSAYVKAWGKAGLMKKVWYFEGLFRRRESIVELLVHNVGSFFADRYRNTFLKVVQTEVQIEKQRALGGFFANVAAFIIYAFVYLRIVMAALTAHFSIGQFTMYAAAFVSLERFMVSQAWDLASLFEHVKYLNAFQTLEKLESKIVEDNTAELLTGPVSVEFRDVSFRYPDAGTPAISGLSFVIGTTERVALVGENGAGKSTVVKLLLRLYEPTFGHILINGKDYRSYTLSSLRKRIGVTFQDFLKFSLPARENIAVGELDYAEQMQAIERAAQQAGVHERITQLPKGYETPLGHGFEEGGVELSGGEWQKVALARSLIKDASLLILDEPTAALDARSEYEFFKELFRRAKKQSILLISHRFSSVRVADRIVVLKNGKIAEQGTHEELMKKQGLYEELYTLQTKEIS